MADEIGEIRARINIVDLVEAYGVSLKRAGKNYQGLCPFHNEKHPSFSVNPALGSYRCWSCGEKGDIFTWVIKTQNLEFMEALRLLADRAGVKLSRSGPREEPSKRKARESAMEFVAAYFREQLAKNTAAKAYCERRGLSGETLADWEIGYAPDDGEGLTLALKKNGYSLAEAQELFLVEGDQSVGYRDKFRGRLMFPIRAERGDLVAFGGRLLGDGHPKYINSGETQLYKKGRVLYGMHRASKALMRERRAVLVEGYLDVIACHQAGVETAMASLGTSLAEEQAKLLKRWVDEVTVLYDGDSAGLKAADRAADVLGEAGLRVRIAPLPAGEDPDSLLRSGGAAAVLGRAKEGRTPLDFRLEQLETRLGVAAPEFWSEAVELLSQAPTELEIARHVDRLAPMYPGVRDVIAAQRALRNEVQRLRRQGAAPKKGAEPAPKRAVVNAASGDVPLHSAELALLCAYVEGFERALVHSVLEEPGLWRTALGERIASDLASAFVATPIGPAVTWIDAVPPETAEALRDLDFGRVGTLNEQFVIDAIEDLRRRRELDEMARLQRTETGDDRLRNVHERLRKLKA